LDSVQSEHPDKTVEVWFQDEARFGQQGTITRVWALRGSRPVAVRQTKYEWLYVISAVCPKTGHSVGLLSPTINTDMMNIFFEQFAAEVSGDTHVVMVWDRAGFHMSKKLKVPEKNKRLLIELDRAMREVNRDTINPLLNELTPEDILPIMEMVAKARGHYLQELFKLSKITAEGQELSAESVKELRFSRLIYKELIEASQALDIAIERGYLDVE